jgi:N-acetylmuramoyl-L-alanine amidase
MILNIKGGIFMPIKVYIDQGHNPRDYNTGAEGNGYFEQDITYEIGVLLYDYLAANPNYTPRLSRPTPETVLGTNNSTSLVARVREANSWGADVFISLHTNAAISPRANGAEALIYSTSSPVAYGLAEDILTNLTEITGLRNRGIVERPGLYVLRRTAMPAVLVEMGFISNPEEAELMANSPNLFALGIYRGIVEYYGS